jgi:hypothetical protein
MFLNKKKNNSRDINVVPKDTKNTYYYMLKSYIDIINDCLSHNVTEYNEKNIYKYKCIISSYLSELKIIYNVNSIKHFIRKYKPDGKQFSILEMLNYLIKTFDNEYAKRIKSEFSNLTKTKKRYSKITKKTYKRN